jgi:hypothetical protein
MTDNNDNITYLFNDQSIDGWSMAGKVYECICIATRGLP